MARTPTRWDRVLEQKPRSLSEHLVHEVARLIAADLGRWPLPIEELDLATGRKWLDALDPGSSRPPPSLFAEAFQLADWELARELDPYDDYMRNRRWLERGLAPGDKGALLFVSRWLVEQMLSLGEATQSRIKRPQMRECLKQVERLVAPS